ncbi:MAG: flavin reductase family protein [Actinomycetota bacterium]|nr:flavin reductase family protein [Actinomycetota bacterium]
MARSERAEASFTALVSQLDYSMLIVTTALDGERAGCLLGFASQVSIHPPRFLVCISVKNRTFRLATRAEVLVVHFVPEGARDLAELFGGETGDELDKFARCDWSPGPEGAPIVTQLENWFAGRVIERLQFGDHWGFLLEPIEGAAGRGDSSLTFHRAKRIEPGHEP